MGKHTEGPWEIVNVHGVPLGVGTRQNSGGACHVFRMLGNTLEKGDGETDLDVLKANAALIAAAPDMLDALERVREAWGDAICDDTEIDGADLVDWLGSWYNLEVMPALRKARGEE